jgi:NADPH-dependent 2,4-dienoyl-CoA reductase/sulfur reductase-like enzyme
VRPCVACNEDCRAFDPALLCTVNPDLAAPGDSRRRAAPLVRRALSPSPQRVAIAGAGPAGLETALTLQRAGAAEIVLFDEAEAIGGTVGRVGTAPNRGGWRRIVDFYAANIDPLRVDVRLGTRAEAADLAEFDTVVVAVGSEEILPDTHGGARTVSQALADGTGALTGVSHLVVVDDGFSWWPHVNAVELGVAAGVEEITLVTPGTTFAMAIPAEPRTSLFKRLRGAVRFNMRPLTAVVGADGDGADLRSATSGESERLGADAVIVVGERRPRDWSAFEAGDGPGVVVIGDAVVPRRVAHAIAEGRAAAETVLAGAPIEPGAPVAVPEYAYPPVRGS